MPVTIGTLQDKLVKQENKPVLVEEPLEVAIDKPPLSLIKTAGLQQEYS